MHAPRLRLQRCARGRRGYSPRRRSCRGPFRRPPRSPTALPSLRQPISCVLARILGGRTLRLPILSAGAGERTNPFFVLGELGGGAGINHLAVVKHIGTVGDLNGGAHVLL